MIAHFNVHPDPLCHLVRRACACVRMGVSVNWSCEKLYSRDVGEDVEGELTRLNQMFKKELQMLRKKCLFAAERSLVQSCRLIQSEANKYFVPKLP